MSAVGRWSADDSSRPTPACFHAFGEAEARVRGSLTRACHGSWVPNLARSTAPAGASTDGLGRGEDNIPKSKKSGPSARHERFSRWMRLAFAAPEGGGAGRGATGAGPLCRRFGTFGHLRCQGLPFARAGCRSPMIGKLISKTCRCDRGTMESARRGQCASLPFLRLIYARTTTTGCRVVVGQCRRYSSLFVAIKDGGNKWQLADFLRVEFLDSVIQRKV